MKYNRIVSYGCSFTAGQELGDAQVLGIPEDELDKFKQTVIGSRADELVYKGRREECDAVGHKLAWPNYIGAALGIPVLNQARFGTSVEASIFSIERDIETGLIRDNDLILVGITSPGRFSWVDGTGHHITQIFDDRDCWFDKNLHDALARHWLSEENVIWNYLHHIRYLDYLSDKLDGRLKMTMAVFPLRNILKEYSRVKKTLPWLYDLKFSNLLLPNQSISNPEGYRHGWRHPKIESHKKYAKTIYDELKRQEIV
jgi:hypothetical protein